ncbi:CHAT domain-containing protein [Streptomyces sp. NPDC004520]|uniref:CHAT domain-containing tetratricopeptide repeat protein n=1 Tax=Streptomyces sp. NPDC004520 TaxID=3364702 RepID=UPI0036A2A35A
MFRKHKDLREAVWDRLRRIGETEDLSHALAPDALREADQLSARIRGVDPAAMSKDTVIDCYQLGMLLWYRGLAREDDGELDRAASHLAVGFAAGIPGPLPEPLLPFIIYAAAEEASRRLVTLEAQPQAVIDDQVRLWERIVESWPPNGPGRGQVLSQLGMALAIRHRRIGDIDDLRRALAACRRSVDVTPVDDALWERCAGNLVLLLGRWFRLASSSGTPSGEISHLDEGIALAQAVIDSVPALPAAHPERCRLLSVVGVALRNRFLRSGSAADLDEAIVVARQALGTTPPGHESLSLHSANLSEALRMRFKRRRSATDLTEAILVAEQGIERGSEDDPERGQVLVHLAGALHERYSVDRNPADLARATSVAWESARAMPPEHEDRAVALDQLCRVLQDSFSSTGHTGDLADAAKAAREAAAAISGAQHSHPVLVNAVQVLRACAEHLGDPAAAEEAVRHSREALRLTPEAGDGRAEALVLLAAALETQHRLREDRPPTESDASHGQCPDLNEAIELRREALRVAAPDSPDRALHHAHLAIALGRRRAEHRAESRGMKLVVADLNGAIEHGEAAAELLDEDHADRPAVLANLGAALRRRFGITDDPADMDRAVFHGRTALRAMSEDHPELLECRQLLSDLLHRRGVRQGRVEDLDEAVTIGRSTVDSAHAQASHEAASLLPALLSDLGECLRARSELTGSRTDLNEAIALGRRAVAATPRDGVEWPHTVRRLSIALYRRAKTGTPGDLTEAIMMTRAVLASAPATSPLRAGDRSNLSLMLWARYENTQDVADLDEAINLLRAALGEMTADDDLSAVALCASNLGGVLLERHKATDDASSLDEAITLARQAVQGVTPGHPDRLKVLYGLGMALRSRVERDDCAQDRMDAARVFAEAADAPAAAAAPAIRAARIAASLLTRPTDTDPASWAQAAHLLEMAVWRLPTVAPRRLGRRDQQTNLASLAGLAADAAALMLNAPGAASRQSAARALQLLEQGRGILIGQALDSRSDLTELKVRHPELARQFEALRDELDAIDDTDSLVLPPRPGMGGSPDFALAPAPHDHRARIATALDETVAQIRELPGHETFLLPPDPDVLAQQAVEGPIVHINVSRYRSDAILVTKNGIRSLALPGLTMPTVTEQADAFYTALSDAHDDDLDPLRRIAAQRTTRTVLEWLWDEAAGPVLDELGFTPRHGGDPLPRMWWILGGPLSLLPIHAAGRHTGPPEEWSRHTVMDRVISSYTPTVRALSHARERAAAPADTDRALIVAMPTTPNREPLVYAESEAERVQIHYPDSRLLIRRDGTPVGGEHSPVKRHVMDELPRCAVAHFACHGQSDPLNPSSDRLLLEDHDSDPLTVAELARYRLDKARLAYLSACGTAWSPAADLTDESIHLASTFQLAGFPHVIGTLWDVWDEDAPDIADAVHRSMTSGHSGLRTNSSAQALHEAVRAARDRNPRTPTRWACHVHYGA